MRSLFTVLALVPAQGQQQQAAPSSWVDQPLGSEPGTAVCPVALIFQVRDEKQKQHPRPGKHPEARVTKLQDHMMGVSPYSSQRETKALRSDAGHPGHRAKARASLCKDGVHTNDMFWGFLQEKQWTPESPSRDPFPSRALLTGATPTTQDTIS